MSARVVRYHTWDKTGDSQFRLTSLCVASTSDQQRALLPLKQRVYRLYHLTGETADVEQVWYRWIELIDAFDVPYATKLLTALEQRASMET